MVQHIIIYIIILFSVAYALKRIFDALRNPSDVCQGCKGCTTREELLKNYDRNGGKPNCYKKK
ncbi:MAG: FeoB-associated Cys-rich membrane protein [Prevotella sp.]|nr:FeoB-associated Cys-rich membrane protein [Prevotella sp.]